MRQSESIDTRRTAEETTGFKQRNSILSSTQEVVQPEYFLIKKDESFSGKKSTQQLQSQSASIPTGLIEKELLKAKVEREEVLLTIETYVRSSVHFEKAINQETNQINYSTDQISNVQGEFQQTKTITKTSENTANASIPNASETFPMGQHEVPQQTVSSPIQQAIISLQANESVQIKDDNNQAVQAAAHIKGPRKSLNSNDKSFSSARSTKQQYIPLKIRTLQIVAKPSTSEQAAISTHLSQFNRSSNISNSQLMTSKQQNEAESQYDANLPVYQKEDQGAKANIQAILRPSSAKIAMNPIINIQGASSTKSYTVVDTTNYFHSKNKTSMVQQTNQTDNTVSTVNRVQTPFSNSLIQNSLQFDPSAATRKPQSQFEKDNAIHQQHFNNLVGGNPVRFFQKDQIIESNNSNNSQNLTQKSAPTRRPITAGGNLSVSIGTNDNSKPIMIMYPRGYNKSTMNYKTETQSSSVMSGSESFPLQIVSAKAHSVNLNQLQLNLSQLPFSTTINRGNSASSRRSKGSTNRASSSSSTPNLKMAHTQSSMAQQYFVEKHDHFFGEFLPNQEKQIKLVEQKNFETNNIEKEKSKLDRQRVSSAKIYSRETQYLQKSTRVFQYIDMKTNEGQGCKSTNQTFILFVPVTDTSPFFDNIYCACLTWLPAYFKQENEKNNFVKDSILFKNYLNHAQNGGINNSAKFAQQAAAAYSPNLMQASKNQVSHGQIGKSSDFGGTPLQSDLYRWVRPQSELTDKDIMNKITSAKETNNGNKSKITRSIKKYACKFSAITFEFGRLAKPKKLF